MTRSLNFGVLFAALVFVQPIQAQPPAETRVVLRISRAFIHKLFGLRFEKNEPLDANENGVNVAGNALVSGRLDVKLHKSDTASEFDLLIDGDIHTQIAATRRPVVVYAHGDAPFRASRRIVFDGKRFAGQDMCITVSNRFALDDITTSRGRPLGPGARGLLQPIVRRGLRDGDRQAEEQIRSEVSTLVGAETDKLLAVLNKAEPSIAHAHEVLRAEAKKADIELKVYRAATAEHLLLSVGRPDHVMPKLPDLSKGQAAPLELWIHETLFDENTHLAFLRAHWKELKEAAHKQLVRRHPALAKELDAKLPGLLTIESFHVKGTRWRVVTFAPKLFELPIIKLP